MSRGLRKHISDDELINFVIKAPSEDSKSEIREHLRDCNDCRRRWEKFCSLDNEFPRDEWEAKRDEYTNELHQQIFGFSTSEFNFTKREFTQASQQKSPIASKEYSRWQIRSRHPIRKAARRLSLLPHKVFVVSVILCVTMIFLYGNFKVWYPSLPILDQDGRFWVYRDGVVGEGHTGRYDINLITSSTLTNKVIEISDDMTIVGGANRLYQNNGDGTSTDIADSIRMNDMGGGQDVAWGDYDTDGDLDVYLTNANSANRLYYNNGDGTFADMAESAWGNDSSVGTGVAWANYDNDGDLDLYLVNWDGVNRLYQNNHNDANYLFVCALDAEVRQPNLPPLITSTPVTTGTEGALYEYDVEAIAFDLDTSDMDGDGMLEIIVSDYPDSNAVGAKTYVFENTSDDSYQLVWDSGSLITRRLCYIIDVEESINSPPDILSAPITTGMEGVLYEYGVEATDADGDIVTYSLATTPEGMSIDPDSELIHWTPKATQVRNTDVLVQADEGSGGTDTQEFTFTVEVPPYIRPKSSDADNSRTSVTDKNDNITKFGCDGSGNLLGNTIDLAYDEDNKLISATDAKGNTTAFAYDPNGNLATITDVLGNVVSLNYDSHSNITHITNALGYVTFLSYDAIDRLISITDPLGNVTTFNYDTVGNLTQMTDGNSTQYAYDETGNLISVTDALGDVTSYSYDENHNRAGVTNANGNFTTYTYDIVNRLREITDPLSYATNYIYEPTGNVTSPTDPKGQTHRFIYDTLNLLTGVNYDDGSSVDYTYDANGNRTFMTDRHETTEYAYDALDRLISVINSGGGVEGYAHGAWDFETDSISAYLNRASEKPQNWEYIVLKNISLKNIILILIFLVLVLLLRCKPEIGTFVRRNLIAPVSFSITILSAILLPQCTYLNSLLVFISVVVGLSSLASKLYCWWIIVSKVDLVLREVHNFPDIRKYPGIFLWPVFLGAAALPMILLWLRTRVSYSPDPKTLLPMVMLVLSLMAAPHILVYILKKSSKHCPKTP